MKKGKKAFYLVGVDEVGRGALAGPVVAAAVGIWTDQNFKQFNFPDSKKLSPKKRAEIAKFLKQNLKWSIGKTSLKEIEKLGIGKATKLALERAIKNLIKISKKPDHLFIDAIFLPNLKLPQTPIIKGDEKCPIIACASIIAKVFRDTLMKRYDKKFPQYGFAKNKGYGTKFHKMMIKKYGISKIHRKNFKLK